MGTNQRRYQSISILIIIGIVVVNQCSTHTFASLDDDQQEDWVPFDLQDCAPSTLVLYKNEEGSNRDFVVKIEVTNLSNMKLGISSDRKIDEISSTGEYFPITETGITTINFSSVWFGLRLEPRLNRTMKHYITVSGQYQINERKWKPFHLQDCYPKSVKILDDLEFKYNLTIDLNVTEIIGDLEILYSYSDFGIIIEVLEVGEYSYNITANHIFLDLTIYYLDLDYGKATGWYRLTTYGRSPVENMVDYELLFLISILGLCFIVKRK